MDNYFTPSRTKPRLIEALTVIATCRYITQEQLKSINRPWTIHIATKQSLKKLTEIGFLACNEAEAYFCLQPSFDFLEQNGVSTAHFTKRLHAVQAVHNLHITDELLKIMKDEAFFTVFYPVFTQPPAYDKDYLIPDACIVYKSLLGYKLEFIEVENPKGNWGDYIDDKLRKYQIIAKDYNTWDRWFRKWSARLELPFCSVNDFCFSVRVLK